MMPFLEAFVPLADKFSSFGFSVSETRGNDISSLMEILQKTPTEKNKPNLIIANTVKGAGVSFIENQIAWHHKVPSETEYNMAMKELDEALLNV